MTSGIPCEICITRSVCANKITVNCEILYNILKKEYSDNKYMNMDPRANKTKAKIIKFLPNITAAMSEKKEVGYAFGLSVRDYVKNTEN